LGRQEAILVGKSRNNYNKNTIFNEQIGKLERNRSNFGRRSSRPDQNDPQGRPGYFR